MTQNAQNSYRDLMSHVRQAGLLSSSLSLLGWDQETMMPEGSGAATYRAQQMAQLAGMLHQRRVDPKVGEWLQACEADDDLVADPLSVPAVNLRELRRQYDRATKLPQDLVETFSRTVTLSRHAWKEAREKNDFAMFQPHLEQVVSLSRERAERYGYPEGGHIWDALAEDYEPGMRAADVEKVFQPLRTELSELVAELMEKGLSPDRRFAQLPLPVDDQKRFVMHVAEHVGFDFQRGRLDTSVHPFCSSIHRDDVRMTTRFSLKEALDALGSTLHETGHGLYEQGLPGGDDADTPFSSMVSLGIHESQSRMIENQVGRSRAFWQWCRPQLQAYFGEKVTHLSVDDLYGSANLVQPSLIRVEADEASYNLHVMIRFDLERTLISGELPVADLPAAWADAYQRYLGVTVPNDADGCMQDVHWAQGSIGYFPTYTLGNLYAAQFYEKMADDLGDLDAFISKGEFQPIVGWLRTHIHSEGRRYRAADLCQHVTGKPLEAAPLLRHLRGKLRAVYGVG